MINPPGTTGCSCGFTFAAGAYSVAPNSSIAPVDSPAASLTLRLSRIKFLLLCSVIALPITAALVLEPERWNNAEFWLKATMLGIAASAVIASIIMPWFYYLRFAPEGLTFQAIGNRRFFTWNEIEGFGILNRFIHFLPLGRCITFRLRNDSPQRTVIHRVIGAVLPYDVSILAVFVLSAPKIIDLLDAWQRRYGRGCSRTQESWQFSQV
jgi:hypothetical protein